MSILDHTAHRPWPVPDGPWFLTQTWSDLLFAHWPVPAEALRPHIPPGLQLDFALQSNYSLAHVQLLPWRPGHGRHQLVRWRFTANNAREHSPLESCVWSVLDLFRERAGLHVEL